MMTKEKITEILRAWNDVMTSCEEQMDQLASIVGCAADTPLGDAVYRVMGAYSVSVADQLGFPEEYLVAWWTDHQFGGRPMNIGFSGEPMRTIKSIDDLAAFIVEDLERASTCH